MTRAMVLAIFLTVASGCGAQAVRGLAEVSIIDRDSGAVLDMHYHHGEYWVAGRPGGRYSIEIHNRMGERLLAVTSVDGVNVVSGETAAWNQGGYVFGPGNRYQITGWRKSDAEVADFTFTDLANSYAARTGRPANIGVIGVAVFRERQNPPLDAPSIAQQPFTRDELARSAEPSARAGGSASASPETALRAPLPTARLGTGHGEREYSYVDHTEFLRLQPQPNQVIRVHYDSLDNLFAMGIIARPRTYAPPADPFPGSRDRHYVPDPAG